MFNRYVYNQVVSILTLSQLTRIFEQYNNFDLRRLLSGSERLINNVIDFTEKEPGFFLNGVECLPLSPSVRETIAQAITSSCQKIKVTTTESKYYTFFSYIIHIFTTFDSFSEFVVRYFDI